MIQLPNQFVMSLCSLFLPQLRIKNLPDSTTLCESSSTADAQREDSAFEVLCLLLYTKDRAPAEDVLPIRQKEEFIPHRSSEPAPIPAANT